MKTLVPSLKCQLFVADIVRSTAELSKSYMLYCLSPACSTTSAIRTRALLHLIDLTAPLRRLKEYRRLIGDFPEYMLQIRLESAVALNWELMDPFLVKTFANEEIPVSKALVHSVAYRLQMHEPSEEGYKVRSPMIFHLRYLHVSTGTSLGIFA